MSESPYREPAEIAADMPAPRTARRRFALCLKYGLPASPFLVIFAFIVAHSRWWVPFAILGGTAGAFAVVIAAAVLHDWACRQLDDGDEPPRYI